MKVFSNLAKFQIRSNFGRSRISAGFAKKAGIRPEPEPEPNSGTALVLSQKSETATEKWDCSRKVQQSPNSATVAIFCDIVDRALAYISWHVLQYCVLANADVGLWLFRKILLIRPKMMLVDDGNYRESRWFTAWTKVRQIEEYYLPRMIQKITGQVCAASVQFILVLWLFTRMITWVNKTSRNVR